MSREQIRSGDKGKRCCRLVNNWFVAALCNFMCVGASCFLAGMMVVDPDLFPLPLAWMLERCCIILVGAVFLNQSLNIYWDALRCRFALSCWFCRCVFWLMLLLPLPFLVLSFVTICFNGATYVFGTTYYNLKAFVLFLIA